MPEDRYQPITLANFEEFPIIKDLPLEVRKTIRIVGNVLPFKTNAYCVEKLIAWDAYKTDPVYILTFPQKDMLLPDHYARMERLLDAKADQKRIKALADEIRLVLNPHPAGQRQYNRPVHNGEHLDGMQHKYRETVLFFPSQGQTCHAYCTFCFRWAQFVGMEGLRFATNDGARLAQYCRDNPQTTDVLFTGGDPLIMKANILGAYCDALLKVDTVRTLRIGTKALAYWPQRFTSDPDAAELLSLIRRVIAAGKHVSIMAHYNHAVELSTPEAEAGIAALRSTGAQIRTQSPILKHINDSSETWALMWQRQVELGLIPYYMFIPRDTGAQRYFEVPLERASDIFREASNRLSGLARSARGPSMSTIPGKIRVFGTAQINGEKVFVLEFLQGRKSDWAGRTFFAKYDPYAVWLSDLQPAFGAKEFFFERELKEILDKSAGDRPGATTLPDPTVDTLA